MKCDHGNDVQVCSMCRERVARITTGIQRVFEKEGQTDPSYIVSALFGLAVSECIQQGQDRERVIAFVGDVYDGTQRSMALDRQQEGMTKRALETAVLRGTDIAERVAKAQPVDLPAPGGIQGLQKLADALGVPRKRGRLSEAIQMPEQTLQSGGDWDDLAVLLAVAAKGAGISTRCAIKDNTVVLEAQKGDGAWVAVGPVGYFGATQQKGLEG